MIAILVFIALGLALSLGVAHTAYALADRIMSAHRRRVDEGDISDIGRIRRDLCTAKVLSTRIAEDTR